MKPIQRDANQPSASTDDVRSTGPVTRATRYGILIADDDEEIRDVLNDGLRREGFDVWVAVDGQHAIDTYCWNAASIHVAMLDVGMPGLDGPQTFALLKRFNPQVACCFMSGHLGSYSSAGLREMGAAKIFWKPFRLVEVAQVLRKLAHRTSLQRTECILDARGCLQAFAPEVSDKK